MDITPQLHEHAPLIQRYGNGGFVIRQKRYETALFITPFAVLELALDALADLKVPDLRTLIEQESEPEVLIVGAGQTGGFLDTPLRQMLNEREIGFDVMDTGAACRSFNVLLAEERRVAALLLPV